MNSADQSRMTGAQCLIQTLSQCGVDACFTNPGTTEMHLVHALDGVREIRSILCLFEGVCTGAADGFGRMMERPASTLLHLGAGFANGIANLHNARRSRSPIVNLVGNHASFHLPFDAPLTSDIESLSRAVSCWTKSDSTAATLAQDGAEAVGASLTANPDSKGQIATLIVGTDAAWGNANGAAPVFAVPARPAVDDATVDQVVDALCGDSMLLLDGTGVSQAGMAAASRIAALTGCRLRTPFAPARIDGGAGRPAIKKLPYFAELVQRELASVKSIVLAGARPPVSFFAYQEVPSSLVPEECDVVTLARVEEDVVHALEAVAELVNAPKSGIVANPHQVHEVPSGPLSAASAAAIIANRLPEDGIVVVDSGSGNVAFESLQNGLPNTWLSITGGSIGQGGPVAIGAAIACPGRRVITLQGDGGAMYTNQSFWTQAREGLDVTTVIYSNREYWILQFEYLRLGLPELSDRGKALFSLNQPSIDWVAMAASMGVPGCRVRTTDELDLALAKSFAEPGPSVIEAEVPSPTREELAWLIPQHK